MFRKLVSNLPYSPALVGQLSFYAKRLKKEEATRRIGLIFTALALVVQSFAVFSPPEAANAASSADFVRGGVASLNDFVNYYDRNHNNIKTLYSSLGITRAEIRAAKQQTIRASGHFNWSMTSLYSAAQGQKPYTFYNSNNTARTVYSRPMTLTSTGGPNYIVYVGHSAKFGWFAIKKDCANLITKKQPPSEKKPAATCENLAATKINRTRVRFNAKASKTGSASIKGYTFFVYNENGKQIHKKRVNRTAKTASYTYDRTKPGSYSATVTVHTSLGDKPSKDCRAKFKVATPPTTAPKPAAYCSGLRISVSQRTTVQQQGSVSVHNGATVKGYTFVIKDTSGKAVSTQNVPSAATSASPDAIQLSTPGTYSAALTAQTSVGTVSDPEDCVATFTIAKEAVCPVNPDLKPDDPRCQPCPDSDDPNLWIEDPECAPNIIQKKTAINLDQGSKPAQTLLAQASDRISYTVTIENTGLAPVAMPIEEQLEDVLQYASLVDLGGGSFDEEKKTLSWPTVELKPGEKEQRTFAVRLASKIPATNTGASDPSSYDCKMVNTFGNSVEINVECPTQKVIVEQVVKELPTTGPRENIIFGGVLFAIVAYFYARARQTNSEVRLIRRSISAGAI